MPSVVLCDSYGQRTLISKAKTCSRRLNCSPGSLHPSRGNQHLLSYLPDCRIRTSPTQRGPPPLSPYACLPLSQSCYTVKCLSTPLPRRSWTLRQERARTARGRGCQGTKHPHIRFGSAGWRERSSVDGSRVFLNGRIAYKRSFDDQSWIPTRVDASILHDSLYCIMVYPPHRHMFTLFTLSQLFMPSVDANC